MSSFNLFIHVLWNNCFTFRDYWLMNIYAFTMWIILGVSFGFILLILGISGVLLLMEFTLLILCLVAGQKYIEFRFPFISVRRLNTYLDTLSGSSNPKHGLKSEDFLPPFVFGHRKYFFSRIVGWKGTWASFLKHHKRRTRSSIFEWGYKDRIPSWHYYVLRGGQRIQIIAPNNFRRVTNASYTSPMWFFSFPVSRKWVGYKDDEWDEYNYQIFLEESHRRMHVLHTEYERPRNRNWLLSSWIEKWAPSLSPRLVNSNYYNSISSHSPYSYFNFPIPFLDSAQITSRRHPTHLGFETGVLYQNVETYETVNPRVIPIFRKLMHNEVSVHGWTLVRRAVTSVGDNYIIDTEALKIKVVKIKYTFYDVVHSKDYNNNYNYSQFVRLYWYHTITEFCSIVFESLYIYPFEMKFINRWVKLGPSDILGRLDLASLIEWGFGNSTILIYLIFVTAYFFICLMLIQVLRVLFRYRK